MAAEPPFRIPTQSSGTKPEAGKARRSARSIALVGGLATVFFILAGLMSMRALADPIDSAKLEGGPAGAVAQELFVDGFVGEIVITEGAAGSGIDVQVTPGKAGQPVPAVKVSGRQTRVGYSSSLRVERCTDNKGKFEIKLAGKPKTTLAEQASVTVRVPPGTEVRLDLKAGRASLSSAAQAWVNSSGCGTVTIGHVAGQARLKVSGAGDIILDAAGTVKASIAGSGDIRIASAKGPADLSIAGSGDIRVGEFAGSLDAGVVGSGDITIDGGTISTAKASIAGSGDISFGGVAESLDASVLGSGDIRFARVTGEVRQSRLGSGDVTVGR